MNRGIRLAASGSQVADCTRFAATVPPVTLTWYQRGAAVPFNARRTVWVAHSDSAPPMLLYWFCIMARIWSTSRLLPPSDGALATAWFGQAVGESGMSGPVKLDSEIRAQSTWNL